MQTTIVNLIHQAGTGTPDAWTELDRIYRPFVASWYESQSVDLCDVEDLVQETMTTLVKELPKFQHNGRTGAFRVWLRTICLNRLLGYRRMMANRHKPVGGSQFLQALQDLAEDDPLIVQWNQEHDSAILRFLFERLQSQLDPATVSVFRRLTIDSISVADVANEFGMTVGAVYVARSRVLRRLREEAEAVFGETLDDA